MKLLLFINFIFFVHILMIIMIIIYYNMKLLLFIKYLENTVRIITRLGYLTRNILQMLFSFNSYIVEVPCMGNKILNIYEKLN